MLKSAQTELSLSCVLAAAAAAATLQMAAWWHFPPAMRKNNHCRLCDKKAHQTFFIR